MKARFMSISVEQDFISVFIILDKIREHHTYRNWQELMKNHPIMLTGGDWHIFIQWGYDFMGER